MPVADLGTPPGEEQEWAAMPLTAHEFAWFTRYLREVSGIELRPGKEALVTSRLERRVRACGYSTFGDYFARLDDPAGAEEARIAVDLMTTNETYFFRESRHFELLPELLPPARDARPLRIWSAACSTGEEAYSIALTLADCRPDLNWEILATDLCGRVLDVARRGLYPVEAAARIPERLLRHCRRGRGDYEGYMTLDPELRRRVTFAQANLTRPLTGVGSFDVVFLRNVLIYFRSETKRVVAEQLAGTLRPGGALVIGLAESLTRVETGLVRRGPSIYVRPVS